MLGLESFSSPVHHLVELLLSQEARVLPELPQRALELLLVLVLQPLLLPLLPVGAVLLPIVQPDNTGSVKKMHLQRILFPQGLEGRTFTYTSTILGVSSFRGIGFFFSRTSRV